LTFESHEKCPSLIEIAGCPGSIGGFGTTTVSSVKISSSKRCRETFAATTWDSKE